MPLPSHIQESLLRARQAYERRPASAVHEDAAALAVWKGGLGTTLMHPSIAGLRTDMPSTLGGTGDAPSPGWYFRAGMASCLATSIAMEAALRDITLTRLEVQAHSESDARGMLGTPDVPAGPSRAWLAVTIEAEGRSDAELRALVAAANAHSPMPSALRNPVDVALEVRVPSVRPA